MAKLIGELLVEAKALTREKLEEALRLPREPGKKLGQLLLERAAVTEAQLTQCLSFQLGVPWVSLYHIEFSRQLLSRIARETAERHCLVPIYVRHVKGVGDTLYVAIEDPMNQGALAEASKAAGLPVRAMIASPSDIRSAIRVYYPSPDGNEALPLPLLSPEKLVGAPERKPEPPPLPPKRQKMPSMSDASPLPAPAARAISRPPPPPGPPSPSAQAPATPRSYGNEVAAMAAAPNDGAHGREPSDPEVLGPKTDRPPRDPDGDSPDAQPELEARELSPGRRARMVALTLLDGTSLALPTRPRRKSEHPPGGEPIDQLTSRDLIAALRALSHGADVSEILGDNVHWEAMFAALLSLLLKKGLLADWEFVEELRKI